MGGLNHVFACPSPLGVRAIYTGYYTLYIHSLNDSHDKTIGWVAGGFPGKKMIQQEHCPSER